MPVKERVVVPEPLKQVAAKQPPPGMLARLRRLAGGGK
jgi:hypothetical protein